MNEPIAIIGIGCRFPGGVDSPEKFWQLLVNGVNAVREIPKDRFDVDEYFDPTPATPGKIISRFGGYLDQVDRFDAGFFGISPREAERMDPQQRLLLEVAWEAFEDAGKVANTQAVQQTGVFIGMWLNDFESRLFKDPAKVDFYTTIGTGRYSASGRLSYVLGLQGPSITIDCACSSSLVSVHLACQSLRSGECDMALAGGANVILQPQITIAYSQSSMMSPDGQCRFGDAKANGYVRSEGAAVILLKRLSQAQADGDPIYAVIRGSSVNNDGQSSGYLATPGQAGQEEMLEKAYANAGVSPGAVQYVEAHGTGTNAGDPVEIGALGRILSINRPAGEVCELGSVKTNLGHTEGAAGIAGLIKVALSLQNKMLPASLHMTEPNPNIPWDDLRVRVHTELTPWPTHEGAAIGGVSSFGIAGTNAHVVLQEAPATEPTAVVEPAAVMLPLSAHSPAALTALAGNTAAFLTSANAQNLSLNDLAYTFTIGRNHHEYRLGVAGSSAEEISRKLAAFAAGDDGEVQVGRSESDVEQRVVFVFPGQGGQWAGMARELMQTQPVFRQTLEACEVSIATIASWSLFEVLNAPESDARWEQIDYIQPMLFAVQAGLAALWRSWGVEPDAILGHSLGEVTGAYVAGVLSLDDAVKVIVYRSQLMRRTSGEGAMAVVGLSMDETAALLVGYESKLSIAVSNSPRSTVISGDPAALEQVLEKLRAQNIFCRAVKVDVASHSPQMEPLRPELVKMLGDVKPQIGQIPIYSTVDSAILEGSSMSADYWGRNLRQPVLFSKMVTELLDDGYTTFIEMSPHPTLVSAIEDSLHHTGHEGKVIPSLSRKVDDTISMLNGLGAVYAAGVEVDWARLFPTCGKVVHVPPYPWQRKRYWLETEAAQQSWSGGHQLLGQRLPELAQMPDTTIWENHVSSGFWRVLRDQHSGSAEALYQAIMLAAVNGVYGDAIYQLKELVVHEALVEANGLILQTMLTGGERGATVKIYGRAEGQTAWAVKASGSVEIEPVRTDWLYNIDWLPQNLPAGGKTAEAGHWVIFSDRTGVGEKLATLLQQRGDSATLVFAGSEFRADGERRYTLNANQPEDTAKLFDEVAGEGVAGVVYLWALDLPASGSLKVGSLEETQALSAYYPLSLVQALANRSWAAYPKLWLVTQAAQPVIAADAPTLALAQSPLWGLGRTVAGEHPDLWGGLVDLSPSNGGEDAVNNLLAEMLWADANDQIAYRGGQRYAARLIPSRDLQVENNAPQIQPDATYLVTGGLGGVGLEIARGLAEKGAQYLVLMGRRGASEATQNVINELEAAGVKVMVAAADVTSHDDMASVLAEVERTLPPLRGVFHAAGVIDDGVILQQDAERFQRVMAPKISGTWNLHELTQDKPLDYFVLFSSVSALFGLGGQSNYAAANAFMDAFAHYRRELGLAVVSVNWGVWDELGLAAGLGGYFKSVGVETMRAQDAVATMHYLLRTSAVNNLIAAVDWPSFLELKRNGRSSELYAEIREELNGNADAAEESEISFRDQLQALPPAEQWDRLLMRVRGIAALVLGFDAKTLDIRAGFFKIGMDSLMSVQLRNRLQSNLNCTLPPTIALEYPTVEGLTRFIYDDVFQLGRVTAPVVEVEPDTSAADELDALSQDELESLLDSELAAIDDLIGDSE